MAVITKAAISTWVTANGATYGGYWVALTTDTPTLLGAVKGNGTPVCPPELWAYAGTAPNPSAAVADGTSAVAILYLPGGLA